MVATEFTDMFGCRLPLQQAGMGGVAGPELVAAVTGAGAMGVLPAAGFGSFAARLEALDRQLAVAGGSHGPYGCNFLMPFLDRGDVEVAAERAALVEFFYDEPDADLVELVHAAGTRAAWQIGSVDEARMAVDVGCDVVIAQGVEAGGHVRGERSLVPILDEVRSALAVPIIAAGGISTAADLARVLDAGACAARVGTRFVATVESEAHPDYVRALRNASSAGDTVLTTAFGVGWPDAPHRVLRSTVEAAEALGDDMAGVLEVDGEQIPLPRFSTPPPTRAVRGAIEAMALYAGEGVGDVREVTAAAEVVRELTSALPT